MRSNRLFFFRQPVKIVHGAIISKRRGKIFAQLTTFTWAPDNIFSSNGAKTPLPNLTAARLSGFGNSTQPLATIDIFVIGTARHVLGADQRFSRWSFRLRALPWRGEGRRGWTGAQLNDVARRGDYQKGSRVETQTRDLPFNQLPYDLPPLLPLANLSFTAAHLVWTLVNCLLLIVTLLRLMPYVEASQRKL